jgi:tetratricopeptide (TPR) repeat protein
MLLARGQNIQARSDLEEAVELSPELAEAWLNLSAAQIATGSAQTAIETARQARDLGASPALAAFNTGIALETLGRYEDAYAAYSEAAQQDPENVTLAAQPARFIWHQG